ncbi:MAG: hypothetical protein U5J64_04505 [Halobacteriales archaeon]|nr:hypothetical protein [Halobacteriales archaeon]
MTSSVGPLGFDYTDEALRILPKVEARLRHEIIDEMDETYGSRYGMAETEEGRSAVAVGKTRGGREPRQSTGTGRESEQLTNTEDTAHSGEVEELRQRVEELEEEGQELRRKLKDVREKNEELREKLEEKQESYRAEDWLG